MVKNPSMNSECVRWCSLTQRRRLCMTLSSPVKWGTLLSCFVQCSYLHSVISTGLRRPVQLLFAVLADDFRTWMSFVANMSEYVTRPSFHLRDSCSHFLCNVTSVQSVYMSSGNIRNQPTNSSEMDKHHTKVGHQRINQDNLRRVTRLFFSRMPR